MDSISPTDLAAMGAEATIVDVREEDEFAGALGGISQWNGEGLPFVQSA